MEQSDSLPSSSKYKFLIVAVCIIALLAVIMYVYVYVSKNKSNQAIKDMTVYQGIFKNANNLTAQGKSDEAVKQYESILKTAPNKYEEGKLRILIASNTYVSPIGDTNTNKEKAIGLFKAIIADQSIPATARALAYNTLANHIFFESDLFYKKFFSDQPYASYLPVGGSPIEQVSGAYKRMLEESMKVLPTSYAAYALAGNYYALAMKNAKAPFNKQMAEEAQKLIKQGDALNDIQLYTQSVYIQSLFFRALGLTASDRILNNIPLKDRALAFTKIVDLSPSVTKSNDQISLAIIYRARLWYAYFLYENYKDVDKDQIMALLKPFSSLNGDTSDSASKTKVFFSTVYADASPSFRLDLVNTLRKISPDLDSYLKSISL